MRDFRAFATASTRMGVGAALALGVMVTTPLVAHAANNTSSTSSAQLYNRQTAASWARAHVEDPELVPNGDCTWFASEALWAGGLPETAEWKRVSPRLEDRRQPTATAKFSDPLIRYLVGHGLATQRTIYWGDNTAKGAQLGDLIVYDWDGPANGTIDHVSIVTGFSGSYPLVSQHTKARLDRGWSWDPGDGTSGHPAGWIQKTHPGSVAYLIHITK